MIPKLESPEPESDGDDGELTTGADTEVISGRFTTNPRSVAADCMLVNKAALDKAPARCTAADASAGATVAMNATITARLLAGAADEETEFPLL